MRTPRLFAFTAALSAALALPLHAAEFQVDIELPSINASDYRRPYIAVWLERPDNTVAANLAVWYDVRMRNDEGTTWLKDMRLWWRRIGRDLEVPVDGVTSATRAPGAHQLSFMSGTAPLGNLSAGDYRLIVEASREHGGREVVTVPFNWPPTSAVRNEARGEYELGTIVVELKP